MKKLSALILAFVLLIFAGCSKTENPKKEDEAPVVPTAYSADLYITYKNKVIEGKYTQKALGNSEIKFTSPRALNGVMIKYEGTKCTFGYAGLSLSTDLSKIPETNLGKMMIESMQSAAQDSTITKAKKDGKWIYTGENSGHEFTITQDAKTGFFEVFEMAEYELKAELRNFTVDE